MGRLPLLGVESRMRPIPALPWDGGTYLQPKPLTWCPCLSFPKQNEE